MDSWLEPQKDQLMSSSSLTVLLCISSHILGDVYKKTKVLWKFMKVGLKGHLQETMDKTHQNWWFSKVPKKIAQFRETNSTELDGYDSD